MIMGAKSVSDQTLEHTWGDIKVTECHIMGYLEGRVSISKISCTLFKETSEEIKSKDLQHC